MKKIGLFGGTFNPIHYGHLRAAEETFEAFGLERVIFIPSCYPPHKETKGLAPASFRAEMVRRAIANNPHFSLSEVEIRRLGRSYSVETITHFRQLFATENDLYFILGLDAFLEIGTWKEYAALFRLCHFLIMNRPGGGKTFSSEHLPVELAANFCYDAKRGGYVNDSGFGVFPLEITALDISATKIRESLRNGRSVKYLLPPAVEDFIYDRKLYQVEDAESAN